MESINSCVLCSFNRLCNVETALVLLPTTPIVGDLLCSALTENGISYERTDDILVLNRTTSDEVLAEFAKTKLSVRERDDIRVARASTGGLLKAKSLTEWIRHTDTAWFDCALENHQFTMFFQPIVDFRSQRIHGHECLVRLLSDRVYNGGEIMQAAVERGRTHIFDSYMRRLSVTSAAAQHLAGTKVFINFLPSSIYDPAFCMKSTFAAMEGTHLKPSDIVFEVVESERIHDPAHLKKICNYYRQHGFGFALDDLGTGSNSLQMVCDLRPDYIKIDKSLIFGIQDGMYRSTVRKIVELADEFGVHVIAEGIEDRETANACLEVGIRYMQGYFFARPAAQMVACARDLVNLAANVGFASEMSPEKSIAEPPNVKVS